MSFERYLQAVTHTSWAEENGGAHNERLEFIGDAVLQLCTSELLYRRYPDADEGALSQMRRQIVNNDFLAKRARQLGLGLVLRLGRGEEKTGGRRRSRKLSGAYEALLGALYLELGQGAVAAVVAAVVAPELGQLPSREGAKNVLQKWVQAHHKDVPKYRLLSESGPAHRRRFKMEVLVAGSAVGVGEGSSKRRASAAAAAAAVEAMGLG